MLAVAAAQILYLDVPDHAAVALAVETAAGDRDLMHYKGLANAVLRRLAADKAALLTEFDPGRVNTPNWLFARWSEHYGEAAAHAIGRVNATEPALDLTAKTDPAGWAERLGGRLLPTGSIRLAVKDRVETLPGFTEGAWWVQDAAASLPARLIGAVAGKRVADLCAAPGGKTAQLAAAGATVTAVDIAPDRLARLEENLTRLGLEAKVVAADILDWRPDTLFDAVLLDAPCTATGTIRRHPDILYLKREDDIQALADLQRRLLARAAELVAPGGTLVYSTCSLEPEEGEAVVAATLAAIPSLQRDPIRPEEVPGLAEAVNEAGELRTLPCHLAATETAPDIAQAGLDGFFVARLRRI